MTAHNHTHNGYVVYPDSIGIARLKDASKYAREASKRRDSWDMVYRVENVTTNKTLREFCNGKRVA